MNRDFLNGLELSKETIDTIMAEYGKGVQSLREQIEDYKSQLNTTKETLSKLESEDIESIKNELQSYKDKEAQRIADEEKAIKEKALTERIEKAFGDSNFINELTRKQLINEMKTALNDEANIGKSDIEVFNALTKDQENIFVNPNQPTEIPPMGEVENTQTKQTPVIW